MTGPGEHFVTFSPAPAGSPQEGRYYAHCSCGERLGWFNDYPAAYTAAYRHEQDWQLQEEESDARTGT